MSQAIHHQDHSEKKDWLTIIYNMHALKSMIVCFLPVLEDAKENRDKTQ
jgi:hypothetical protein